MINYLHIAKNKKQQIFYTHKYYVYVIKCLSVTIKSIIKEIMDRSEITKEVKKKNTTCISYNNQNKWSSAK